MYAEQSDKKTRSGYHIDTMATLYQLLPTIGFDDNEEERASFNPAPLMNEHSLLPDFSMGDVGSAIDDFSTDIDAILNESLYVTWFLYRT